jgi:hypothetical protein
MASPNSTLPPKTPEEVDNRYNPEEHAYQERMGGGYVSSGADQAEAFANDPKNHTKAEQSEEESLSSLRDDEQEGFYNPRRKGKQRVTGRIRGFIKKRAALIGILGVVGIGGGISIGFFGPASMLQNIADNLTISNDSVTTSMQRRFMNVFGFMTGNDAICANNTKNLKCKMGRISNQALNKLSDRANIKPIWAEGTTNTDSKRGYPSRNPTGYTVVSDDGVTRDIPANQLTRHLGDNPRLAAKVLGRGGAFNVGFMTKTGGYFNKFLGKFGLQKNGGLADGQNRRLPASERLAAALEKLRSNIPGNEKLRTASDAIRAKVDQHTGKAKKAGVGYMVTVAGCIAVKIPGYVAAGVAGAQILQVMPVGFDTVLSPASKQKASGVEPENAVTAEDMDTIGTLLTERSPRESDGELSSALNSSVLLSAMGVDKGKPAVSESFAPGYSILQNPLVTASADVDQATRPVCNAIMSPAAMYTAMAVDAAVTVAASATIVGGIAKVVASFAVSAVVAHVVGQVASDAAQAAITAVAENDAIATAQGEDLGDLIGVSALAFFASNGMARHLPTLKMSQLARYAQVKDENEAYERELALASLSPFDVTSRHTFLGSIVHNLQTMAIANGSTSPLSLFSTLPQLAFSAFNPSANAATNQTVESCGYAAAFGMEGTTEETTPAINNAGLPCTANLSNLSTSDAIDILEAEGWIDGSKNVRDNASIDDLREDGVIVADTLMTDTIDMCSYAETGDYITNSGSCTVNYSNSATPEAVTGGANEATCANDEGTICEVDPADFEDVNMEGGTLKDSRSLEAVPTVLGDFQLAQLINEEDVAKSGETPSSEPNSGRPANAIDKDRGWTLARDTDYSEPPCDPRTVDGGVHTNSSYGWTVRLCKLTWNPGVDNANGSAHVSSLISTNVMNMFEAARAAGIELGLSDGMRRSNPGYFSEHTTGLAMDLGTPRGGNTICRAGANPRTGWGSYENAQRVCLSMGGAQYKAYQWLNENAATYGFYNYLVEPWHWSTSGA